MDLTSSRINYYDGEKRMVELENSVTPPLGTFFYYYINNESQGDSITDPTVRIQGGQFVDDFYKGCWLECCSLSFTSQTLGAAIAPQFTFTMTPVLDLNDRFKRITEYNNITRIAKIESNYLPPTNTFPNNWRKNMSYRIRRTKPLVMGWGTHAQGVNENLLNLATPQVPNNCVVPYNARYYSRWEPFTGVGLTVTLGLGADSEVINIATIVAPGSGYVVGDVVDVLERAGPAPEDPFGCTLVITEVDGSGGVLDVRIIDGGRNYINPAAAHKTAPHDNHVIKGPCQPFIQGIGVSTVPVAVTSPANTTSTIPRGGLNGQNNTTPTANNTSGTGPGPGRNGAVYRLSLIKNERGVAGTGYVLGTHSTTAVLANGLTIVVDNVNANGEISSIRIGQPGSGYSSGITVDIDHIAPNTGTTAQVLIEAVGQSVDISNAVQPGALLSGSLYGSGSYVKQLLYISSKGPERYPNPVNGVDMTDGTLEKNPFTGPIYQSTPNYIDKKAKHSRSFRNNGTATGVTPIGKSQQLPALLEFNPATNSYNEPVYAADTTGSSIIMGFFRELNTGTTKGMGAGITINLVYPLTGAIIAITISSFGSGYAIGDYLTTIIGGAAVFVVTKVDSSGSILGIAIVDGGMGYLSGVLSILLVAAPQRELGFFVIRDGFEVPVGVDSLEATLLLNNSAVIVNPVSGGPIPYIGSYNIMLRSGTPIPVDWEVQQYFCDGVQPYNYTGSTVSQNQMVCYELALNSLVLPNVILESALGGFIAFYPFIYVEIQNYTAPSGHNKNIIYSNNPNSTVAIFKAAIDNTPTPVISKFIRIDGDREVQTIKFKPNDNLKFRVYFGDGETFRTLAPDNAPPLLPNPYLQITALFEFKRV